MTCDPSLDVGCKIGQVYMGFVLWSLSSSDCDCLGCLQGISSLEIGNSVGVNKIFEKDDVALVEQVIRMSQHPNASHLPQNTARSRQQCTYSSPPDCA